MPEQTSSEAAAMVGKTYRRKDFPDGPRFKVDRVEPNFHFGKEGKDDGIWFVRLDTNQETIHPLKKFLARFEEDPSEAGAGKAIDTPIAAPEDGKRNND